MSHVVAGISETTEQIRAGISSSLPEATLVSHCLCWQRKLREGNHLLKDYLNHLPGTLSWCYFPPQSLQTVLRSQLHPETPPCAQMHCRTQADTEHQGESTAGFTLGVLLPPIHKAWIQHQLYSVAAPISSLSSTWRPNLRPQGDHIFEVNFTSSKITDKTLWTIYAPETCILQWESPPPWAFCQLHVPRRNGIAEPSYRKAGAVPGFQQGTNQPSPSWSASATGRGTHSWMGWKAGCSASLAKIHAEATKLLRLGQFQTLRFQPRQADTDG